MNKIIKQKVFVGMSGGVDSSVSALLLQQQGYEVIGVFIKVWQPDLIECTWKNDRRDAMRVCATLNISFLTLDLQKEYTKEVIDYMLQEYKLGRTPNPDIFCNSQVKFGAFLQWALKNDADFIATGHYSKIQIGRKEKKLFLQRAKDKSKDQAYFLWTLNQKQLSKIIFPVGNLLKSEVRKIAEKNNLIVAHKKDSQGLCFIGQINFQDFLKKYLPSKNGKIVLLNAKNKKDNKKLPSQNNSFLRIEGHLRKFHSLLQTEEENKKDNSLLGDKIIGQHDGVIFYTLGQKVLGYYVIKKDLQKNILYVAPKDWETLESSNNSNLENILISTNPKDKTQKNKMISQIILEKINFNQKLEVNKIYEIENRYHATSVLIKIKKIIENLVANKLEKDKKELTLELEILNSEKIIFTSGQSLVFYEGDLLIGGGILK